MCTSRSLQPPNLSSPSERARRLQPVSMDIPQAYPVHVQVGSVEVSDYEKERQRNIAENQQCLINLGLIPGQPRAPAGGPLVSPPSESSSVAEKDRDTEDEQDENDGGENSERMQFRGGGTAEARMAEIIKAALGAKDNIWQWGNKGKVLKAILDPLNNGEVFQGTLKMSTLENKWRAIAKKAESIIEGGEERFIKLAQNGGRDLSELDQLYLDLARKTKAWRDQTDREKIEKEEASQDARDRQA